MTIVLDIKRALCLIPLLFFSVTSISQAKSSGLSDEIRKMEKQFESDLNEKGAAFAFEKYAAPNAVIKRQNDSLIYGPAAIRLFYSDDVYKNAKAFWAPDYIDISADGTMAYTYGKYQWKMVGKTGQVQEYSGIFHTVWRRQPDGTWKYVWD